MKKNKVIVSPSHLKYLRKNRRDKTIVWVFRLTIFAVFLFLWEILTYTKVIDSFLYSSPSRVAKTLKSMYLSGELLEHTAITLYETMAGFLIATVLGTIIALALWWSEILRKILDPYIVVLNSLPKIALGPIIIIWFGIGVKSIIFMAVFICIVITILTMLGSFLATDANKILLLSSMGANKWQLLTKLVLPQSIPVFISLLKINIGLAWIGAIMGEYLVSRAGLGYLIIYGGQVFKLDLVMASTVILCALAALMYLLVALIEKFAVKWKD